MHLEDSEDVQNARGGHGEVGEGLDGGSLVLWLDGSDISLGLIGLTGFASVSDVDAFRDDSLCSSPIVLGSSVLPPDRSTLLCRSSKDRMLGSMPKRLSLVKPSRWSSNPARAA